MKDRLRHKIPEQPTGGAEYRNPTMGTDAAITRNATIGNTSTSNPSEQPDDALGALVQRAIELDEWLKGNSVRATAREGEVTLTGEVANRELSERATAVAVTVRGVQGVTNDLSIRN